MIDKFKSYYENQIKLAQNENELNRAKIYQDKLKELEETECIREFEVEPINPDEPTYLFKDMCTLTEFIDWFYYAYPSIFVSNVLKLRTGFGSISYVDAYKLYPNGTIYLEPVYKTVNLMDDNKQILGELYLEEVDLYLLCSISTEEYDTALEQMYDDCKIDF